MEANFLVYSTCSGASGDRPSWYGDKYPTNAAWCRRVLARTDDTRGRWPLNFAPRSTPLLLPPDAIFAGSPASRGGGRARAAAAAQLALVARGGEGGAARPGRALRLTGPRRGREAGAGRKRRPTRPSPWWRPGGSTRPVVSVAG